MDQAIEERFESVCRSKTFANILRVLRLDRLAVLDIGCSYGEHLVHFGPGSVGLSVAKDEVQYAQSKGLDVRYGNIECDELPITEKFDAIFCNNLLEHLYSPHSFLLKIKGLLRPDGFLVLGVPCIPRMISLLHVERFRGSLAVAHINFFTRETLTKTVERAGYTVQQVRTFRFASRLMAELLRPICPHFYAVAKPDPSFRYHEKRLKELVGYADKNLDGGPRTSEEDGRERS